MEPALEADGNNTAAVDRVAAEVALGLSGVLRTLHHTWDEVGLPPAEQRQQWEGFVHEALEPLVRRWVHAHRRTKKYMVQTNDALLQKMVWLVFELRERPREDCLAALWDAIEQHGTEASTKELLLLEANAAAAESRHHHHHGTEAEGKGGSCMAADDDDEEEEEEEPDDDEDDVLQLLPFQLGGGGAASLPLVPPHHPRDAQQQQTRRRRTYWRRIRRWLPFFWGRTASQRDSLASIPQQTEEEPAHECRDGDGGLPPGGKRRRSDGPLTSSASSASGNRVGVEEAVQQLTRSTHRQLYSALSAEVRRLHHIRYCRGLTQAILAQQRALDRAGQPTAGPTPTPGLLGLVEAHRAAIAAKQLEILQRAIEFPSASIPLSWILRNEACHSCDGVDLDRCGTSIFQLPPTRLTDLLAAPPSKRSSASNTQQQQQVSIPSGRPSAVLAGPSSAAPPPGFPGSYLIGPGPISEELGLFLQTSFYHEAAEDRQRYSYQPLHIVPTPDRLSIMPRASQLPQQPSSAPEPVPKVEAEAKPTDHAASRRSSASAAAPAAQPLPGLDFSGMGLPASLEALLHHAAAPSTSEQDANAARGSHSVEPIPCLVLGVLSAQVEAAITALRSELRGSMQVEAAQFRALLGLLEGEWAHTLTLLEGVARRSNGSAEGKRNPEEHEHHQEEEEEDGAVAAPAPFPTRMVHRLDCLLAQFEAEYALWEQRDYGFLQTPFTAFVEEEQRRTSGDDSAWWKALAAQRLTLYKVAVGRSSAAEREMGNEMCALGSLRHLLIGSTALATAVRHFARDVCQHSSAALVQQYERVLQQLAVRLAQVYERYYAATGDAAYANPPALELELIGRCPRMLTPGRPGRAAASPSPVEAAEVLFAPLQRWVAAAKREIATLSRRVEQLQRRLVVVEEVRVLLAQRQSILNEQRHLLASGPGRSERLLSKRVNMAKQLLQEEAARHRAAKALPAVMRKLASLDMEWHQLVAAEADDGQEESNAHADRAAVPHLHRKQVPGDGTKGLCIDGVRLGVVLAQHTNDLIAIGITAGDHRLASRSRGASSTPTPTPTPGASAPPSQPTSRTPTPTPVPRQPHHAAPCTEESSSGCLHTPKQRRCQAPVKTEASVPCTLSPVVHRAAVPGRSLSPPSPRPRFHTAVATNAPPPPGVPRRPLAATSVNREPHLGPEKKKSAAAAASQKKQLQQQQQQQAGRKRWQKKAREKDKCDFFFESFHPHPRMQSYMFSYVVVGGILSEFGRAPSSSYAWPEAARQLLLFICSLSKSSMSAELELHELLMCDVLVRMFDLFFSIFLSRSPLCRCWFELISFSAKKKKKRIEPNSSFSVGATPFRCFPLFFRFAALRVPHPTPDSTLGQTSTRLLWRHRETVNISFSTFSLRCEIVLERKRLNRVEASLFILLLFVYLLSLCVTAHIYISRAFVGPSHLLLRFIIIIIIIIFYCCYLLLLLETRSVRIVECSDPHLIECAFRFNTLPSHTTTRRADEGAGKKKKKNSTSLCDTRTASTYKRFHHRGAVFKPFFFIWVSFEIIYFVPSSHPTNSPTSHTPPPASGVASSPKPAPSYPHSSSHNHKTDDIASPPLYPKKNSFGRSNASPANGGTFPGIRSPTSPSLVPGPSTHSHSPWPSASSFSSPPPLLSDSDPHKHHPSRQSSYIPPRSYILQRADTSSRKAESLVTSPTGPGTSGVFCANASQTYPPPSHSRDPDDEDPDSPQLMSATSLPGTLAQSTPSPTQEPFHRTNSAGSANGGSRSMNPAFCLSPRAFSDDALSAAGTGARQETPRRVMAVLLDKEKPARRELCDVALADERHSFLFTRCTSFLPKMTPASIVQSLVPVLLACLENDGENHDQPEDSSIEVVARYCLPEVFEAVRAAADIPMMAAFVMPLLHLCTAADRRTFPMVSECLRNIADQMPDDGVVTLMVPLVHQLRFANSSIIRAIAAGVLHAIAARPGVLRASNSSISRWFSYYVEAAKDPCPIVRESAVEALTGWVDVATDQHIPFAELPFPLFNNLMADDLSDTVRFLLVDRLMEIAQKIGKAATSKYICPPFYSAVKDRSWRVRYRAARCLGQLAILVVSPEDVLSEAVYLSKDEEVEIRAAVAEQLGVFVPLVSASAGKDVIVPTALRLADDENRIVQLHMIAHIAPLVSIDTDTAWVVCKRILSAMEKNDMRLQAYAVSSVCTLVEILHYHRRGVGRDQLLPGIHTAVTQQDSTPGGLTQSNSFRLRAGSKSANSSLSSSSSFSVGKNLPMNPSAGPAAFSTSVRRGSTKARIQPVTPSPPPNTGVRLTSPATAPGSSSGPADATHEIVTSFVDRLTLMSRSGTWRVREAVLSCIPSFALVLQADQFQKLNSILRRLLLDPVSKVRQTATEALEDVADRAGPTWAATMAYDLLSGELGGPLQHSGVWRLLTLRCLTALLPVAAGLDGGDPVRAKLRMPTVRILQAYTEDPVPMIRTALAESLGLWKPWFVASSKPDAVAGIPSPFTSGRSTTSDDEIEHFFRLAVQKLQGDKFFTAGEAAALLSKESDDDGDFAPSHPPSANPSYSAPSSSAARRLNTNPSSVSHHPSIVENSTTTSGERGGVSPRGGSLKASGSGSNHHHHGSG
eukprot:gene1338-779_t